VFTKTKIAICVAVVVCSASAGFAKDQNAGRNGADVAAASGWHSFGQAQNLRSNPTRHGQSRASAFATVPARQPISGAEWWQNRGNADDMGLPY
jgi:hypothetical protein